MKKRFTLGKANNAFLLTVFMLMAFITVFLLWNKSVAAEEPRTEACFDVEAGVASLMEMDDEAADKWATVRITPEEAEETEEDFADIYIQNGCTHTCTFCKTNYLNYRLKSTPIEEIKENPKKIKLSVF